ncbi:chromosome partitioning protein, ParB family [Chitinophaga costaii]|uniref:Chromosome partitioning protein, ParB family n=1 Tax=Chitinophaga costaii TaxID=1335309 RepID=A0A1C3Z546_9BACT|nr:ParB/RepB/Spo0J family partition protein [Chitinophaga costaii]PUZ30236.1 ParB/RepB/Spo0J family partition protein [Chitinophaga costaii]SCB77501.1 chromosome partitioning protein, ParB family [Chitinophaga costaii]
MSNPSKKEALGKGIRSLLQNIDTDLKQTAGALSDQALQAATGIERIAIDRIEVNPKQPRRDFDEQALQELAASIRLHDVIQPVTIARIDGKRFQLIAGERRWRASKIAGLKDIPAYIRQVNDQELLELALLENLQRENLNAIEIGLSYKRLMEECVLTQEEVADRMGKERSTVTNYIRLLKLPPDIQVAVRNGSISMGHARALSGVENVEKQLFIFNEIVKHELSVRATEELVRKVNHIDKGHVKKPLKSNLAPAYQKIEDHLASYFATKVKLDRGKNGKGSIQIEFYTDEELDSILEKIDLYSGK